MDLGGWLRSLGLEKYEAVLRASEIDEAVLHNLTEDHLRELGFPLGARLKLLNAIATIGSSNPAAPTPVKLPPTPSAPLRGSATTEAPEAAGERRHVTVMFCDLVDSTGIAAKLDAEEWRDLVGAYLDTASAAVTEMGGKVAKKPKVRIHSPDEGSFQFSHSPQWSPAIRALRSRRLHAGVPRDYAIRGSANRSPVF